MPIVIAQIATVLILAFGAVLVLSKLEKEVVAPTLDALEPILNPGALVLAVVGIFLITRARR